MASDEPQDDQEARAAAEAGYYADLTGLPFEAFGQALRSVAVHAAEPARADPQNLPWISRGPRNLGGRISVLAQDHGTPRILYAGAAHGGLWKTENAGETWRPLNAFLEGSARKDVAAPIGAIALCHRQTRTLYVGTGEPRGSTLRGFGLFRSDDGGESFARIDPPPGSNTPVLPEAAFNRIVVDPWEPDRVWLATPRGLWTIEPTRAPADRIQQVSLDVAGLPATNINITDLVIDFGDRTKAEPEGNFTVYIGAEQPGTSGAARLSRVLKSVWDKDAHRFVSPNADPQAWVDTKAHETSNITPADTAVLKTQVLGRVRLALCTGAPGSVYAVFGAFQWEQVTVTASDGTVSVSTVFRQPHTRVVKSSNGGTSWTACADPPDVGTIPWYALCLEVDPHNPQILILGCMDLFRSTDGGGSWTKSIDWTKYREGDRAQHADQHAILFDGIERQKIWVGNDGGISASRDLGRTWTKPSHGIVAAQFYEFAVHPDYPYVMGGGLQDNGAWTGFGGPSWVQTGVADGGGMAFQPRQINSLLTCNQVAEPTQVQFRLEHYPSLTPSALGWISGTPRMTYDIGTHLADRPTVETPPGTTTYPFLVARINGARPRADSTTGQIFGRPLEGHPTHRNWHVIGWNRQLHQIDSGSLDNTPPDITPGAITSLGLTGDVSAIAFDKGGSLTIWVGTTRGELFFSTDRGGSWTDVSARLALDPTVSREITGISVHPLRNSVVAISLACTRDNVIFSTNARARSSGAASSNWRKLSHPTVPVSTPAADRRDLPASPCGQVVFDPRAPGRSGRFSVYTLYAATLGGVYVCRNVTTNTALDPDWFAMSRNMPIVMARDLEVTEINGPDGSPDRRILRAATFGRGIWECDLDGTPEASLYIRSTCIEDGRRYHGSQLLTEDPRLKVLGQPAPAFDMRRSVDIRIDAPPYSSAAGVVMDGVEFDEGLRSDPLQTGARNFIHVQLHSRGFARLGSPTDPAASGADARPQVHVYYADAIVPPGPDPVATAPPLQAGFWTDFPNDPPAGAVWRKAGRAEVTELDAGNPRVARLDWAVPSTLADQVAILAIADHPLDPVSGVASGLPLDVDPSASPALIPNTTRAALLITPCGPGGIEAVGIRDGLRDTGTTGEVAWGGRSADIVVVQSIEADPDTVFANIEDPRVADHVKGDSDAHIYVRAHNRGDGPQDITVDLFAVPLDKLAVPADWIRIGAQQTVSGVPPRSWRFAPVFTWAVADIPDPAPASASKSTILVALLGGLNDPTPDHTTISSLVEFWDFFLGGARPDQAAMRALIYRP